MIARCGCCGDPATVHERGYADGAGWFCNDCVPIPRETSLRIVSAWQAATAAELPIRRRATVVPFPPAPRAARRLRARGAA